MFKFGGGKTGQEQELQGGLFQISKNMNKPNPSFYLRDKKEKKKKKNLQMIKFQKKRITRELGLIWQDNAPLDNYDLAETLTNKNI